MRLYIIVVEVVYMLKEETIKLLQRQKEEKFSFENTHKLDLVNELMENIGDPDGEIRDGLIYPCLAHLLYDKHFEEDTLSEILDQFLSNDYLFYDILENSLNSVLVRSFTSLQLVILLYVHKRDSVISEKKIKDALTTYISYFEQEPHLEGYNETVGWLHSIAHGADVFDQFVSIEYFTEKELTRIFEIILLKMKQRHHYYSNDEDERIVVAMTKAIKRDLLSEEYLLDYIERFSQYEKNQNYPEMYYITKNTRNVLRALYFSLLNEEKYQYLIEKIKEVLEKNVTLR